MKVTIEGVEITLTEDQKKQICEALKPKEFWEPKDGEKGYFVTSHGEIAVADIWSLKNDKKLIAQGRVFQTEEEATLFSKREAARYKLKKRIWELNDGEYPKWNWTYMSDKYYPKINPHKQEKPIEVASRCIFHDLPNWFYLKTETACEQLIAEMPNELRIVLGE